MMEDRFNGLKCSNEDKKGPHCKTIQIEGPKMKLESSKKGKEQDFQKQAKLCQSFDNQHRFSTRFQGEFRIEDVKLEFT